MEEILIISKIKYYIIVFDNYVYFFCEIFNNFICGIRLVFFNILIYVILDENEGNC